MRVLKHAACPFITVVEHPVHVLVASWVALICNVSQDTCGCGFCKALVKKCLSDDSLVAGQSAYIFAFLLSSCYCHDDYYYEEQQADGAERWENEASHSTGEPTEPARCGCLDGENVPNGAAYAAFGGLGDLARSHLVAGGLNLVVDLPWAELPHRFLLGELAELLRLRHAA